MSVSISYIFPLATLLGLLNALPDVHRNTLLQSPLQSFCGLLKKYVQSIFSCFQQKFQVTGIEPSTVAQLFECAYQLDYLTPLQCLQFSQPMPQHLRVSGVLLSLLKIFEKAYAEEYSMALC
ncbi:Hypothetical_protein [Hexamita inflata]|uniref:Hypothetical_protein n=1 Tax=Hexamita inflata TaxID=28002 RepID=A0AA86RGW4_9EUKA|nr:Hypothetical protein HINF_LOCUS60803 [Hexamita inflata]